MNRILNQFVEKQYSEFKKEVISGWALDGGDFDKFDAELKPIFKRYLSLACIATLVGRGKRRNEYIQSVIEASQLSLVLAMKGYENPCCVLLRQCIELVLKHVYFSTHPVEYEWVTSHEGYRDLTFQKLLDFWVITEEYRKLDTDKYVYDTLSDWFGVLSRHVHVHSRGFMGYGQVGFRYRVKVNGIKKLNERTREIWPLLTIILIAQFPKCYYGATPLEKRVIRNFLPVKFRERIDQYLQN